jgi:RNA ligase (TIGR02306 family)
MSTDTAARKLVTIRTVAEVLPIPGADKIELARVDGWQCVVKKGEFAPGAQGVYFEIDSWLPSNDTRFGFLEKQFRKNHIGELGARIRTIKLRGQLSQGLLLPVSDFPELCAAANEDLAPLIGVSKWEPPMPACLAGVARGNFPYFLRKTDQERVQNIPHYLEDPALYEVTVKLDGSSMTVYNNDGQFGVCSRNLDLTETDGNTFWSVARAYGLPMKLAKFGNIAIQGELIGEGIQANHERIAGHDFYVFDVFDIARQEYVSPQVRYAIVTELGLRHVPVVDHAATLPRTVAECLAAAEGENLINGTQREGIVFKRLDGQRSFKAISNTYLLNERD